MNASSHRVPQPPGPPSCDSTTRATSGRQPRCRAILRRSRPMTIVISTRAPTSHRCSKSPLENSGGGVLSLRLVSPDGGHNREREQRGGRTAARRGGAVSRIISHDLGVLTGARHDRSRPSTRVALRLGCEIFGAAGLHAKCRN